MPPSVVPVVTGLVASPERVGASGIVLASFDLSEPLPPEGLEVTFAGTPMTCGPVQATSPHYTCDYTLVGDEVPDLTEAARSVLKRRSRQARTSAIYV